MPTILADQTGNLETERLFIRRFALSDAPFIIELLNQKSFIQNIRDIGVRNNADAEIYIKLGAIKSYEQHGFGLSLVSLKDGTPIGMCGLIKRDNLPDVDIGFAFLPSFEGKGYATESSRAVLEEGKTRYNLTRVVAITNPDNQGSINVLMKAGLQFERMIRLSPDAMELKLFAIAF